jgi:4-hydroxybenzoate polyprenyltransferase
MHQSPPQTPPPAPAPPSLRLELLGLLNPPLAVAAAAESLTGALAANTPLNSPAPYLLAFVSALLFAAGSAFGHYFDRENDAKRRPERPLPAGRIDPGLTWRLALMLLGLGILLPLLVSQTSGLAGIGVALAVVLYAAVAKNSWGAGFLVLGIARSLNLVLGLTAWEGGVDRLMLAALPVLLHAIGWALLRACRQPGAPPNTGFVALLHLGAGASALLYQIGSRFAYRLDAIPFLLLYLGFTFPPVVNAVLEPRRPLVATATQYSFLGLTMLEATLAAGYDGIASGLIVALLGGLVFSLLRRWPVSLLTDPR